MICNVTLDAPTGCCVAPRTALLAWGYAKLIVGAVLLLCAIIPFGEATVLLIFYQTMSELTLFIVFGLLTALVLSDIVLHSILVAGIHKKKMHHLVTFVNYSKVMWVVTPTLGLVCAIIELNDLMYFIPDWKTNDAMQLIFTQLVVMFISLIIQTCIIPVARSEIRNIENTESINNEGRGFNVEFTLKIESSGTKKRQGNENDNTVDGLETTCEKAKLTE